MRLVAGNARIAGLCAVALWLTAFLAIGGPLFGASGTLCEPQNATTCSRGGPRGGADARTTCAVASGSQEALVARSCSSAWSWTMVRRSRRRPSEGRAGGARLPWMRRGAGRVVWSSRDATRWRGGAGGGESVGRATVSGPPTAPSPNQALHLLQPTPRRRPETPQPLAATARKTRAKHA